MERDNPGYVYAYGWNRFALGIIGAWPENNQNFVMKNRALLYAVAVTAIAWLPMAASLVFLKDDLNEMIACLVFNVPIAMSIYKLVLFRVKRKVLVVLLSTMAKDWAATRTNEQRKVMLEKAKFGRFISIMSVLLAGSMFVAFSSVRFCFTKLSHWKNVPDSKTFFIIIHVAIMTFLESDIETKDRPFLAANIFRTLSLIVCAAKYDRQRQFITNETRLGVGFFYPVYFPFDTKELRIFLPTWIGQFFVTIVSLIAYSGPDSSMSMIVLHLCGQLAAVRISLANIVDEECIKNPKVYWERLSSIIKKHEELNRLGELLEASFNVMLLVQMILCTVTFSFQGFMTVTAWFESTADGQDFPFFQRTLVVIHGFYTILHLFVYCWAGDLLVVESTALSRAPYESDWFRLQPVQAKALMMVTNRSRIPLQITAGKFVGFSLELFTSIMKTSMGYLSVLLAMKDS